MTTSIPDFGLGWAAELHTPILEALTAGTREAAISAMNAHFDEINKRIVGSPEPPSITVRTVA
jgi:DNA-binding GntR family transcriptional regulator